MELSAGKDSQAHTQQQAAAAATFNLAAAPQDAAPAPMEEEADDVQAAEEELQRQQQHRQLQQQQDGTARNAGADLLLSQASQQDAATARREEVEGKRLLRQMQPPGGAAMTKVSPAAAAAAAIPAAAAAAGRMHRPQEQVRMTAINPGELTYHTAATGTVLADWLFKLEQLFSQLGVHQTEFGERMAIASRHWDRQVNVWWNGHEKQAQNAGTPVASWAAFVGAISTNFASEGDADTAASELLELRMKAGEKMDVYMQRAALLLARADGEITEGVAARIAMKGVDTARFPFATAQVRAAMQDYTALHGGPAPFHWVRARLTAAAANEPRLDTSLRGAAAAAASSSSSGRAGAGGKGAGSAGQQRINAIYEKERARRAAAASKEGAAETTDGKSGTTNLGTVGAEGKGPYCFRCKREGHTAATCSEEEQRTCYGCGTKGHLKMQCPQRKEGQPKND
jgi:hypothetical protein